MLFFKSKEKSVKKFTEILIAHAEKLTDGIEKAFNGGLPEPESVRNFIFRETMLLLLHLVSRIGDRELNNSQNNGLFNMLSKCVAEHLVVCVENITGRREKETAIRDFFETVSRSEIDYSMCSEGFLEKEPFSEKSLFSKFARKIVEGKNKLEKENHHSVDDSQFHADMTIVLDMFLTLYPKLNLEHLVVKVGKDL